MKKFLMFLLIIFFIFSVGFGIFSIIESIVEKKDMSQKPHFKNGILGTRHWGAKDMENTYAIYFYLVQVSDPQGINTIDSVVVNSPSGSLYATLFNDGEHCDGAAEDDIFGFCESGDTIPPELGPYTLIVTDEEDNSNTKVLEAKSFLEVPQNFQPGDGSLVKSSNPVFSWDAVDGAAKYSLTLLDCNNNMVWQKNEIVSTSIQYDENELVQNKVYRWGIRAIDETEDHESEFYPSNEFTYLATGKPT